MILNLENRLLSLLFKKRESLLFQIDSVNSNRFYQFKLIFVSTEVILLQVVSIDSNSFNGFKYILHSSSSEIDPIESNSRF